MLVVSGQGMSRCGRSAALLQAAAVTSVLTVQQSQARQEAEAEQDQDESSLQQIPAQPTPAELRSIMTADSSDEGGEAASSTALASRLKQRSGFLLRMARLQHNSTVEDAPTLLVTRNGDVNRARREMERFVNAASGRSNDSNTNNNSDIDSFLSQATARCARAPYVQQKLAELSRHLERLSLLSTTLATSRGILDPSLPLFRSVLSPSQLRCFQNNDVAPALLQEIARVRAETEECRADGGEDCLNETPSNFDSVLAAWVASAAVEGGFPISVVPLPDMRNSSGNELSSVGYSSSYSSSSSASGGGGGASDAQKKLAFDISTLARSNFSRSAAAMSPTTAASCVAALRYRCLSTLQRERAALFSRVRHIACEVRDFVESTAAQGIRSVAGRVLVADGPQLIQHGASILSRLSFFRAVLVDDAEVVLAASPLVSASSAGAWLFRPMLSAWASSIASSLPSSSFVSVSAAVRCGGKSDASCCSSTFALTWNPHACAEHLRSNAAFNLATSSSNKMSVEPVIATPLTSYLRLMVTTSKMQQQQQNNVMMMMMRSNNSNNMSSSSGNRVVHVLLADDGITQGSTHPALFNLRRALTREALNQQMQQISSSSSSSLSSSSSTSALPVAAVLSAAAASAPFTHFSTNSSSKSSFARSLARPVSVWAIPPLPPAATGSKQSVATDEAAAAQMTLRAMTDALDNLADLAPRARKASSASLRVAFISERGNLLAFDTPPVSDSASFFFSQQGKWSCITDLASVPSTVESLVLVLVPQALVGAAGTAGLLRPQQLSSARGGRFSCLRCVSDSGAAMQLLHRACGAVVCITPADIQLQMQQALVRETIRTEQQLAEIAHQQLQQPLKGPAAAQQQQQAASLSASLCSLWQRTEPWMRALFRSAFECRGGGGGGGAGSANSISGSSSDADVLFGGVSSCCGPALEICCPRHQQQARGFLLLTAKKTTTTNDNNAGEEDEIDSILQQQLKIHVVRLLPANEQQQQKQHSSGGCGGGLYGTCSLACLAKYDGCSVRSHMCLRSCHENEEKDDDDGDGNAHIRKEQAEEEDEEEGGGTFSTLHVERCPFPCSKKLPCGHDCGLRCGAPACECTIQDPVVVLERPCGEMCVVGVDSSKNPQLEFYRHRALVMCDGTDMISKSADETASAGGGGTSSGASPLGPCREEVDIECGRCHGRIRCVCCEQPMWLWSDALAEKIERQQQGLDDGNDGDPTANIDPASFYFRCQSCRDPATCAADGEELEKVQQRHKMLVKRTALLAARDGANTSERVAAILKRREELQAMSAAAMQRAAAEMKKRVMESVAAARSAFAKNDTALADLAAHRVQFFQNL